MTTEPIWAAESKNSLAKWAFALGILGIVPLGLLASLPAIICGHLSLRRAARSAPAAAKPKQAVGALVLGYIGLALHLVVLPVLALPALFAARQQARIVASQSQLSCIGRLCFAFKMDRSVLEGGLGRFPNSFAELQPDNPDLFVCRWSGTQPGPMALVDEWSDYALVPGRTGEEPRDAVLAYGKPLCFPGGGGNVLYVDGSVQWHEGDDYSRRVQAISSAPPPLPKWPLRGGSPPDATPPPSPLPEPLAPTFEEAGQMLRDGFALLPTQRLLPGIEDEESFRIIVYPSDSRTGFYEATISKADARIISYLPVAFEKTGLDPAAFAECPECGRMVRRDESRCPYCSCALPMHPSGANGP